MKLERGRGRKKRSKGNKGLQTRVIVGTVTGLINLKIKMKEGDVKDMTTMIVITKM